MIAHFRIWSFFQRAEKTRIADAIELSRFPALLDQKY
jgi:hypothetical protein